MTGIFLRMLEVTAFSSAIILAVFIFRVMFAKKIRPGVIGALWALVLLRLCLPVMLESPVHLPQLMPQQQETVKGQHVDTDAAGPAYAAVDYQPESEYVPETPHEFTPQTGTAYEPGSVEQPATSSSKVDWFAIAAYVWIAGAAAILLSAAWKGVSFGHTIKQCGVYEKAVHIVDGIKPALKIRRDMPVRIYGGITTPVLFGLLRPQILLPENCRSVDFETLRCILAHELCHVKRHDILKGYIWLIAKAAHWFNPFVWLAYGACKDDIELCCDEMVLRLIGADNRFMYTQSLIDMFRSYRHALPAAVPLFEKRPKLTERVMRMLEPNKRSKTAGALSILLALIMLVAGFTTACSPAVEAAGAYEAPNRWTDSFEQGTLQVYVDADVTVPDAASFPTYEVNTDAKFSQETADKMIKTFFGDAELYQAEAPTRDQLLQKWMIANSDLKSMQRGTFDFPDDWDEARKNEEIEKTQSYKDTVIKQSNKAPVEPKLVPSDAKLVYDERGIAQLCCYAYIGGEKPASLTILNSNNSASVEFENNGGYNGKVNTDAAPVSGLTISKEDARLKADELIKNLGLDDYECAASYITSKYEQQPYKECFAHAFVYTKNISGLPAAPEVVPYLMEYTPETILINVDDKGVCDFKWENMFQTGNMIEQNAKLMPFDRISGLIRQKICRQYELLIDSMSNEESQGEDWRKTEKYTLFVDRVSLEYARMPLGGDLETQVLTPVWCVYASNEELTWEMMDGEKRLVRLTDPFIECILTINALDGSIIGES